MTARAAVVTASLVALLTGSVGLVWGTWAVGGSDSSCYGLMAQALARLAWQPSSRLALDAPWPDAQLTFAPAGFVSSPVRDDAASPVCAPGFSLLAAPVMWAAGDRGLFWLSPLAGVALVWLAFLLGRRLAGEVAGTAAALLTATSPILLYQVVQPMNDVAAAACWLAGLAALVVPARRRIGLAGAAIGVALLLRPNLLPAGAVLGVVVWAWQGRAAAFAFGASIVPFGLAVLALNDTLYGSPFGSGYGDATALFALDNVPLNLARHLRAIFETQWGLPLLGAVAPWVLPAAARRAAWAMLLLALAVVFCYLPYASFPEWWYLRFLLPAVVVLTVLASSVLTVGAGRVLPGRAAAAAVAVVVLAASAAQGRVAWARQVFVLHSLEARFRLVGEAVRDRLPPGTAAVAVWDSGSIRFGGGSEVVVWDSLAPDWLDRAVAWLRRRGPEPVIVVERWEESAFRQRFESQAFGALDWPPRFDIDGRVRIFATGDRARYLAGEAVPTETIWNR